MKKMRCFIDLDLAVYKPLQEKSSGQKLRNFVTNCVRMFVAVWLEPHIVQLTLNHLMNSKLHRINNGRKRVGNGILTKLVKKMMR